MAAVQYFTRNNQPKTHGGDGGRWHRPHDRARTFGERDGNDEGDEDDDDEYNEDGDIPDKPFDFFLATTNQKQAGLTEGGWDRPHNRARTLGECDGNKEGNKDEDKEYGEDGDIPDDYDKYAGGHQTTKNYTTTNQKHAGLTGERRDMRRNWQGVRWEHKLIVFWQLIWDSVKN
jgi:hypothetical protein